MTAGNLPASVDQYVTPKIYDHYGTLSSPFFVGLCIAVLMPVFALIVVYFNGKADRIDNQLVHVNEIIDGIVKEYRNV